ncbi:MAG: NmrA family transcriptional regulator [Rhizobiaceae bacterium]|nr:NmrA family transcriptional regulator [Rhizobiaceae bacterium]
MNIILGGTGQVGSAVARALLRRGEPVTVVVRHPYKAEDLRRSGAEIAVADIGDAAGLRAVFRAGSRAFLLVPNGDPAGDADRHQRLYVDAIIEALAGSGLEKVVAASTYGARPGGPCGDLTVLYGFEEKLRAMPVQAVINRAAYYMSNWSGMAGSVLAEGVLPSFFPEGFSLPMVAPEDVGEAAARRLVDEAGDTDMGYVEGPRAYTPRDVADAFSDVTGRPVVVNVIPRESWEEVFVQSGFSQATAQSYACMTSAVLDGSMETPRNPARGTTELRDYIRRALGSAPDNSGRNGAS